MPDRVKITTPMPTYDEVADRLGVGEERRREIAELGRKAVSSFYTRKKMAALRWKRRSVKVKV